MLCIIVILKNKFLWLFFFFNDVIPFISVCWHSDRCFIQMFRTVSRVRLNRERRFKQETDHDVCLHVFWLFVTAVQRLRAVCLARQSSWEAVRTRAAPTESSYGSVITATTTGTSCVAVLFISMLFCSRDFWFWGPPARFTFLITSRAVVTLLTTFHFYPSQSWVRASVYAHHVWRALLREFRSCDRRNVTAFYVCF